MISSLRSLCLIMPALLLLAACEGMTYNQQADVMTPAAPHYIDLVPEAPPPPRAETPPRLENPRMQIWRSGHWSYGTTGYSWVPGETLDRPSPTAVWAPDHWVKHEFGWSFTCGTWQ